MRSYTAEEIREAYKALLRVASAGEELIGKLEKLQEEGEKHIHDWADDDTVTVREIREAWNRRRIDVPIGKCPGVQASELLKDISEHREPEYPPSTIWKDYDGAMWVRIQGKRWGRLAQLQISPDSAPKRPLRQMT